MTNDANHRDIIDAAAVYDGRTYLGDTIAQRNGQFEAADANGRSLGIYADRRAATDAVIRAAGRLVEAD